MAFAWNNSLVTGNTLIDTQHQQLFKAINDLLEACSSGHGKDRIDSTMRFLIDYTAKHFGEEEILQQKYHYPNYQNHKKLHENFKKTISELAEQLKKDGATIVLTTKISASTGDWLVRHINNEDKKVAAHIHKEEKK